MIRAGLRNPVLVSVKDKEGSTLSTPASLDNFYTVVENPQDKLALLVDFVKRTVKKKSLVFFSTCAGVEYFSLCLERLLKNKFTIFSIHGKKGQKRHKVFEAFKKASEGLLLCTDVMARGNKVYSRNIHSFPLDHFLHQHFDQRRKKLDVICFPQSQSRLVSFPTR